MPRNMSPAAANRITLTATCKPTRASRTVKRRPVDGLRCFSASLSVRPDLARDEQRSEHGARLPLAARLLHEGGSRREHLLRLAIGASAELGAKLFGQAGQLRLRLLARHARRQPPFHRGAAVIRIGEQL